MLGDTDIVLMSRAVSRNAFDAHVMAVSCLLRGSMSVLANVAAMQSRRRTCRGELLCGPEDFYDGGDYFATAG